ncbi:methylated-DNA--[protein]-cysteine S-methyltransferase [Oceanivirga salmonicida]|uniref:methylated-DNA--[protein]-cysteine S-methyltransferase n=1 Tax=Oceanivirga salmonicida TaxID=1769291 RepID=UPI00082D1F16|nr:methylated-DNA--[protein]-cysteine S-methyltransferase [Oceanivirga salmonicida]
MNEINVFYYKTKIGELIIGSYENKLCLLDFRWRRMRTTVDNRIKKELQAEFVEKETKLIIKTKKQIDEYLEGKRKKFNIPLLTVGTDFQKQVWTELINIPYGQTVSYLDLANKINNPKAVRAVAGANGANAISVIIPCHRVINSNGELGGYGGGLAVKKRLLKIEKENGK